MTSVLIADDEALMRSGLRMILEAQSDIKVVGEAEEGAEAITLARELAADVVLMDIRMPGMDGLEATRRLLANQDTARVLILTTFDLDEYVYEALKAGASGFILKTAPADELVRAIRSAATGEALVSPAITRRLIEAYLRKPTPRPTTPDPFAWLTDRERDVLRLVTQGLSNAEIAEQLFLSQSTVKTHVNRILTKIHVRDRVQAVVLAYESGFVVPGFSDPPNVRDGGRRPDPG
jgi:DNA-binding NarL/FixJ family response regulator